MTDWCTPEGHTWRTQDQALVNDYEYSQSQSVTDTSPYIEIYGGLQGATNDGRGNNNKSGVSSLSI